MKTIQLTQNQVAIVDDEDYKELSKHRWCAYWDKHTKSFYAMRALPRNGGKRSSMKMHRQITGASTSSQKVDHINHDTLDNRRSNLRIVSNRVNRLNSKARMLGLGSSTFPGVTKHKKSGKWQAQINIPGRKNYIGLFDTEVEAHEAYMSCYNEVEVAGQFWFKITSGGGAEIGCRYEHHLGLK